MALECKESHPWRVDVCAKLSKCCIFTRENRDKITGIWSDGCCDRRIYVRFDN